MNKTAVPKWNNTTLSSLTVPKVFHDILLQIAITLDNHDHPIYREGLTAQKGNNEAEQENISIQLILSLCSSASNNNHEKVINLSGIKLRAFDGLLGVLLEDLVKSGYRLEPASVAQLVDARIRRVSYDQAEAQELRHKKAMIKKIKSKS